MHVPPEYSLVGNLTGRARGRRGWFGRIVLEVEFWTLRGPPPGHGPTPVGWRTHEVVKRWRDASADDLLRFAEIRLERAVDLESQAIPARRPASAP